MGKIENLTPGEILNNEKLTEIFLCGPQGGMRKSNTTNTLVIVSNHVESIYNDRWIGDTLYYTGMGRDGDQDFEKAQNKTLFYSETNGVSVYLFEVFKQKEYTFIGKVELNGKPSYEEQLDENDKPRKVCIFPLKIVGGVQPFIKKEIIAQNEQAKIRKIKKLDDNSLLSLAKKGNSRPGTRNVTSVQYERNLAVVEYAKRMANGVCQLCQEDAPFLDLNKKPYLETHHIVWLSNGGEDTIENTIALCPNCHKKMHIVNDRNDVNYLKDSIKNRISKL